MQGSKVIAVVAVGLLLASCGTDRMDTRLMIAGVGRIFAKVGAEGVYCGALPELGLGFALKCDDGAVRAAETMTTLEQFFQLDCNVSETAKKLYIHRNTLLYRLDKFKQETGLDVRTFNNAVLVKIAMLLYKVTKRK